MSLVKYSARKSKSSGLGGWEKFQTVTETLENPRKFWAKFYKIDLLVILVEHIFETKHLLWIPPLQK